MSVAALLCACVGTEKVNVMHTVCLPLATYSQAEQAEAAKELQALPPNAELGTFMVDYGKMRAGDRACLAAAP